MVDMAKKIHKKGAEFLAPGEKVIAASTIAAVGQFKKSVAFGAVGGLAGAAIGSAIKGKADEAEGGSMADDFPDHRQAILALSNQRWLLFEQGAMSGAPKALSAEWPHDQIKAIEIEKGKLTSKVSVVFADGSTAQAEAIKAAKPEQLAEALSQIR